MKTYTFLQEHFSSIINHTLNIPLIVETLTLSNGVYTMVCEEFAFDEYEHLHEQFGLTEIN